MNEVKDIITYQSFDPEALDKRQNYALQTSLLVPRPIAWVVTLGPGRSLNCAPFSYFMGVSSKPPLLAFAVGERRTGPKDTVVNLKSHPEFTVNIVTERMAEAMVETSVDLPPEESELEFAGLASQPSEIISTPRIAGAPVQIECRVHQMFEVEDSTTTMIIGRILQYHIDVDVLNEDHTAVNIHALKPVGRLGGKQYCRIRDVFEMSRSK